MYFTRTVIRTEVEHAEVSVKKGEIEIVDKLVDIFDGTITDKQAENKIRKARGRSRTIIRKETVKTAYGIDKDTFFAHAVEIKNPPANETEEQ